MGLRISIISGTCVALALAAHGLWSPEQLPAPQVEKPRPAIGSVPAPSAVCAIDNLGVVGLGPDLPGGRYAIVSDHLVRLDAADGQILSILRRLPCPGA